MPNFEHMTPLTPENLAKAEEENNPAGTTVETSTETQETETQASEAPGAQETQTAETTQPVEEPKPDEFIENFNKHFDTQYKTDDEIKPLFTLPGKVKELEDRVKDHDELSKSVEQYREELERTKTTYMSDLLSEPLMKQAYVASQLQKKHPNLDKDILAELAMADIDKMDDLEIVARERKMRLPKSSLDAIKAVIKKEIGAEAEQSPEEWDALTKTELEMKSADARERIKQLLQGIELPKVVTKEEREAQQAQFLEEKKKLSLPFKEIFKKFDEYQNGDLKFVVDEEYKSGLEDMFDGMFIDGGLEINDKNLATAEKLKRAMFVEEYLPKILEVRDKETEARVKAEYDKLVHNDVPPNTATATDETAQPEESGLSNYLRNQPDERARKF
jgi:hypothetical protein